MKYQFLFLRLLILIVSACTPIDNTGSATPFQSAHPPTGDTSFLETILPTQEVKKDDTQMTQPPTSSGIEFLIEKAKEDLAQRLSISINQIELIKAETVTWPDASLGCPQPGMAYIQVPQDGTLIVFQVEEKTYEYHNGGNRGVFLCEKTAKKPDLPQLDIQNLTLTSRDNENSASPLPDNSIPPGEDK